MENQDRPAFGFVDNRSNSYEDNEVHYGLTKREYFAAMAMQGLLSGREIDGDNRPQRIAADAVEYADALLKKLSE